METKKYRIVKYRPEFKKQLLKIQAHLWGENQSLRAAYLDWKYNRNPYVDETYIYVALYGEQVVGMVGVFGVRWIIGHPGRTFPGLCFSDLVILPDHRSQNLFQKLMQFALDDLSGTNYDYVFDLSSAPHVALVLLMQGWRRIYLQSAIRRIDPVASTVQMPENKRKKSWIILAYLQFRSYASKFPILAPAYHKLHKRAKHQLSFFSEKKYSRFADLDRNAMQIKTNPHVFLSKTSRSRAMAELAARIETDGHIRHVKDEQYFNWRFQNPLSDYRFLFWENGRLEGYFVLYTKLGPHNDDAWAYIVDWEATSIAVWKDLLRALIQWGSFKELFLWSQTLPEDVKTLLKESGFTFIEKTGSMYQEVRGENILVKPLCQQEQKTDLVLAGRNLLEPRNWDLRMIYSDAY